MRLSESNVLSTLRCMQPRLRQFLHSRDFTVERFHEMPEARRARILVSRGVDVILDIGANIGQYAAVLRAAGYRRRIVSFEPVGEAFAQLSRRCAPDALWEARRTAVFSEAGRLIMNVTDHLSFSSVAQPRAEYVDLLAGEAAVQRTEKVAAQTLDALMDCHVASAETFAVKMDVQGSEGAVLDGGPKGPR